MRVVVCDTGPILHLWEAGCLDLLSFAGDVMVPEAVHCELREKMSSWETRHPAWLKVERLTPEESKEASLWLRSGELDPGECEAIALARSRRADWLLTDDTSARLFATLVGLEVHGSLGVVLWAAATGKVTRLDAERILDRLAHSSLWISQAVLEEARRALSEIEE